MSKNLKTRDMVDVTIAWALVACVVSLLIVAAVAAPLFYIWTLGLIGCFGTLALTLTIGGSMMSSGSFFDIYVGMKVIEGGFQIIGMILVGLASASSND